MSIGAKSPAARAADETKGSASAMADDLPKKQRRVMEVRLNIATLARIMQVYRAQPVYGSRGYFVSVLVTTEMRVGTLVSIAAPEVRPKKQSKPQPIED